jgi:hypothetical protein
MIDTRPHSYRSVSQNDSTESHNPLYDEESLNSSSWPWWDRRRKFMRIKRPRKSTIFLFLVDVLVVVLLVHTLEPLITLLRRNEELFKPRVSLQGLANMNGLPEVNGSNPIPRILHQTTATDVIPDKWVESQRSCKEAYGGDFEYKVSFSLILDVLGPMQGVGVFRLSSSWHIVMDRRVNPGLPLRLLSLVRRCMG